MVCVSSLFVFLSFCALAFVGFLLLYKDTIFTLSHFFLTTSVSHETLCLTLDLFGVHSAAAAATSKWALTKFFYSLIGICVPDISRRVSNLLLTVTIYLLLVSLLRTSCILWFGLFLSYFCVNSGVYLI